MSSVRRIIQRHTRRPALAGAAETPASGASASGFDRDAMRRELDHCRRSREIGFWICVGVLVVVFVLSASAAVLYRADPGRLKGLYAATGAGVMSLVATMISLWQQKVKADLVTALATGLNEESLKAALNSLVSKL